MTTIVIITEECANSIQGVEYTNGVKFNPTQLLDGRWFVSEIEQPFIDESDVIEVVSYEFEIEEE
jgi:hypothetical protein